MFDKYLPYNELALLIQCEPNLMVSGVDVLTAISEKEGCYEGKIGFYGVPPEGRA
jgi:hypothetical protein